MKELHTRDDCKEVGKEAKIAKEPPKDVKLRNLLLELQKTRRIVTGALSRLDDHIKQIAELLKTK